MRLGLTTRKVAELSRAVALEQSNEEFSISHARLVQIENEESIPSIYKLFTLSSIYGVSIQDLLSIYLDLEAAKRLHFSMQLSNTHLASFEDSSVKKAIPFPIHFHSASPDAGTDLLSHMVQVWGEVPASLLEHLNLPRFRYGFIGLSDYTMYPLIRPGSVVQIDDCRKVAKPAQYRTEFDRPIYFLESRSGYLCSWCEVSCGRLLSIPHPLSPCRTQVFSFPSQVEVIGRVTGVAVRLVREEGRPDSSKAGRSSVDVLDARTEVGERIAIGARRVAGA
jgi:transcriptional regulator with XRE-family HTH domain